MIGSKRASSMTVLLPVCPASNHQEYGKSCSGCDPHPGPDDPVEDECRDGEDQGGEPTKDCRDPLDANALVAGLAETVLPDQASHGDCQAQTEHSDENAHEPAPVRDRGEG